MQRCAAKYWKVLDCRISKATEVSLFLIGTTFSALIFLQVVLRYVFNTSIIAMDEVASYLFVWFVFLGAGLAVKQQMHAALEFLVSRLDALSRVAVVLIAHGLALAFYTICIVGSVYALPVAATNMNLALNISIVWAIAALPVGFLLMAYHQINLILYEFVLPPETAEGESTGATG